MYEYYYLNECKRCRKISYTNKEKYCKSCHVMMPNDRWNVVTIDPEFFIIRQKSIF